MFATCIIGTYHKPHPNNIKVGVVGPTVPTAARSSSYATSAHGFRENESRAHRCHRPGE
jgi:hypothetical protein